jgi:hypothetical protein
MKVKPLLFTGNQFVIPLSKLSSVRSDSWRSRCAIRTQKLDNDLVPITVLGASKPWLSDLIADCSGGMQHTIYPDQ